MDLKKIWVRDVDWINLAQDRVRLILVNTERDLLVL
jgi:hypothetical protein